MYKHEFWYVAIRRPEPCKDGVVTYTDEVAYRDEIGYDIEGVTKLTDATDEACGPEWAERNPVLRISRIRIEEVEVIKEF